MLFDPAPKTKKEDLFGRDEELDLLNKSLKLGERLIVIYGVRRVGKTSLLRTAFSDFSYPNVIIDVREVHSIYGRVTKWGIYSKIAEYFTLTLNLYEKMGFKLSELFKRVKGFRLSEFGVEVEPSDLPDMAALFRRFNDWATRRGTRFVVAFDEAQYLRFSGGVRYDELLAWVYDNLENITVVITGSEVGVLRDFLKLDDPKAPLYGRYIREIMLGRYSRETSLEFLRKGFKELDMSPREEELTEVVEKLDGLPGWLTYYGYLRGINGLPHREALEKVFEEGSKLVMSEVEKVIGQSKGRYLAILEAVAAGAETWKQIKTYVSYKIGPITDARFTALLKNLINYGLIEKDGSRYIIADPVIKWAVKESARG